MTPEEREPLQNPLQPAARPSDAQRTKTEEELRLETLRRKKESERKEREQALWREASRMSELPEIKSQPDTTGQQKNAPHQVRTVAGLFARLKLGKLL